VSEDYLIWTEVFGCGQIIGPLAQSFLAHHEEVLTVFGSPQDLEHLPDHPRLRGVVPAYSDFGADAREVARRYAKGHSGTAYLWSGLMLSEAGRLLVHLDSDQVLLGDVLTPIQEALERGASIAGPRRPQKVNVPSWRPGRTPADTVATFCFGMRPETLTRRPRWVLEREVAGRRMGAARPLDFFDPVTTRALRAGLGVSYLDSPDSGPFADTDWDSPFLRRVLAMPSAAASGCALSNRGIQYSERLSSYQQHAIKSWNFYATHLLGVEDSGPRHALPGLEERLMRLDRHAWRIRD
jgi:hypothetical protein